MDHVEIQEKIEVWKKEKKKKNKIAHSHRLTIAITMRVQREYLLKIKQIETGLRLNLPIKEILNLRDMILKNHNCNDERKKNIY